MNLDSKEAYLEERRKLNRLETRKLEELLGELYHQRFVQYDVSVAEYYRVVSSVYNARMRSGGSLIYHLKNFVR